MQDRGVLVITITLDYSKVPIPILPYFFATATEVPRYYFCKAPSTGSAVLLRSAVPTTAYNMH